MLILITGGASTGKSKIAENIAVRTGKNIAYIATMIPNCKEALKKIEKHTKQREKKCFTVIERFNDVNLIDLNNFDTALLECLPTLVSNEMFKYKNEIIDPSKKIYEEINDIKRKIDNLIVVTNNVFSDGIVYDEYTTLYMKSLAKICGMLSSISDIVIESAVGIPIYLKGRKII